MALDPDRPRRAGVRGRPPPGDADDAARRRVAARGRRRVQLRRRRRRWPGSSRSPASVKARNAARGGRAAVSQVDGGRWLTMEGPVRLVTDPDGVAAAVAGYAARYRAAAPSARTASPSRSPSNGCSATADAQRAGSSGRRPRRRRGSRRSTAASLTSSSGSSASPRWAMMPHTHPAAKP